MKYKRKAPRRRSSYDRAYRRTSLFLAGLATPIVALLFKRKK